MYNTVLIYIIYIHVIIYRIRYTATYYTYIAGMEVGLKQHLAPTAGGCSCSKHDHALSTPHILPPQLPCTSPATPHPTLHKQPHTNAITPPLPPPPLTVVFPSAKALTSALPTITPSAPHPAIFFACSGLDTPNPTATCRCKRRSHEYSMVRGWIRRWAPWHNHLRLLGPWHTKPDSHVQCRAHQEACEFMMHIGRGRVLRWDGP